MEPLLSKGSAHCLYSCLKNRNHFITDVFENCTPQQKPLPTPERPEFITDGNGEDYCVSVLGKILDIFSGNQRVTPGFM
jgi:hypothetical protein